eukprot:Sspe_Gene.2813::Locus_937_Transcript_1_1_Confidence_1.000_Length_1816::g.2813::m.2813
MPRSAAKARPAKAPSAPARPWRWWAAAAVAVLLAVLVSSRLVGRTRSEHTPLLRLVYQGEERGVAQYVEKHGAQAWQARDGNNFNALHYALDGAFFVSPRASTEGHLRLLAAALKGDPTLVHQEGVLSPIFHALSYRNIPGLELLLQLGDRSSVAAALRQRDANGMTALLLACRSKASGMARLFMANPKGLPPRLVRELGLVDGSSTKPRFALLSKQLGVQDVELLLQHGADCMERDGVGRLPLHVAAMEGMGKALPALLASCPQALNASCDGGWTPSQLAAASGHVEVAKELGGDGAVPYPPPAGGGEREGWGYVPSGGWAESVIAKDYDAQLCDVAVEGCDLSNFAESYLALNRPVLITGCLKDWPAVERWSKQGLLEKYGDVTLSVGKIAYPETYGIRGERIALRDWIPMVEEIAVNGSADGLPPLAFDGEIVRKTNGTILGDFTMPSFTRPGTPLLTQFTVAPPLSGASAHFHGYVFNALVHGRKRWVLIPPADAYFTKTHVRKWFDSGRAPRPGTLHCIQRAGDIMFVPRNWGHAVINVQTSVAIISEY